jgi:predicted nucleotidyltransferase
MTVAGTRRRAGMTVRRPIESLAHPDITDPSILTRIADRLRERLGATRVIVYGSVARGEATIHSDIDLLVVAPSDDRTFRRLVEAREVIRDLSFGIPVSPLVLTPDEVQSAQSEGDAVVQEIFEDGVEI